MPQIEEKNIGLQFGEKFDALRAVLRFANDGDIFVGIEKLPQAIAKNSRGRRLVVPVSAVFVVLAISCQGLLGQTLKPIYVGVCKYKP